MTIPVDPATTALLVIDIQKDFCEYGYAYDRSGRDIAPIRKLVDSRLLPLIEKARRVGMKIAFIRAEYDKYQFVEIPELCLSWTAGAELFKLRPNEGGSEAEFVKNEKNAFSVRPMQMWLASSGIKTVIVSGITTDNCVLASARGAAATGLGVLVPTDCVGAAAHRKREHLEALRIMESHPGITILTLRDLIFPPPPRRTAKSLRKKVRVRGRVAQRVR